MKAITIIGLIWISINAGWAAYFFMIGHLWDGFVFLGQAFCWCIVIANKK